ncbi:MAG: MgtC/SapB family protein [Chitinophagaceae bacterium]|nr:MgtC/SapB family protein [Chitinophagaceae bacterium]
MISWTEVLIRLFSAAIFGAIVGLERERKQWSAAGLRTHMMVCVGACLIMMVSAFGFSDILVRDKVVLDPSRVAAQVVSGIGFIGAGTIVLLKQTHIRGLTTAAGLWTVAAIGLAAGGGMYFAAGVTTIIALMILWALKPFERKLVPRTSGKYLRLTTVSSGNVEELIGGLLLNRQISEACSKMDASKNEMNIYIVFSNMDEKEFAGIIVTLQSNKEVKEISWGDMTAVPVRE